MDIESLPISVINAGLKGLDQHWFNTLRKLPVNDFEKLVSSFQAKKVAEKAERDSKKKRNAEEMEPTDQEQDEDQEEEKEEKEDEQAILLKKQKMLEATKAKIAELERELNELE